MPGIPPGESDYRPVVYVSGVYSDEDPTSRNRTKLDEAVEMVLASNGSPVCPALLHFDSIAPSLQSTTYDKLSIGALFSFSPQSPYPSLTFEKVSEGYSRCLADGIIGPDLPPSTPASKVIVYYHGRNPLPR